MFCWESRIPTIAEKEKRNCFRNSLPSLQSWRSGDRLRILQFEFGVCPPDLHAGTVLPIFVAIAAAAQVPPWAVLMLLAMVSVYAGQVKHYSGTLSPVRRRVRPTRREDT